MKKNLTKTLNCTAIGLALFFAACSDTPPSPEAAQKAYVKGNVQMQENKPKAALKNYMYAARGGHRDALDNVIRYYRNIDDDKNLKKWSDFRRQLDIKQDGENFIAYCADYKDFNKLTKAAYLYRQYEGSSALALDANMLADAIAAHFKSTLNYDKTFADRLKFAQMIKEKNLRGNEQANASDYEKLIKDEDMLKSLKSRGVNSEMLKILVANGKTAEVCDLAEAILWKYYGAVDSRVKNLAQKYHGGGGGGFPLAAYIQFEAAGKAELAKNKDNKNAHYAIGICYAPWEIHVNAKNKDAFFVEHMTAAAKLGHADARSQMALAGKKIDFRSPKSDAALKHLQNPANLTPEAAEKAIITLYEHEQMDDICALSETAAHCFQSNNVKLPESVLKIFQTIDKDHSIQKQTYVKNISRGNALYTKALGLIYDKDASFYTLMHEAIKCGKNDAYFQLCESKRINGIQIFESDLFPAIRYGNDETKKLTIRLIDADAELSKSIYERMNWRLNDMSKLSGYSFSASKRIEEYIPLMYEKQMIEEIKQIAPHMFAYYKDIGIKGSEDIYSILKKVFNIK